MEQKRSKTTSFTSESKDFPSTKESKEDEDAKFVRKRSVSSSSSMLNGFCNTLDRISRDHGGVMVSEEEKRVNRGKMNLISKIVTPILCLSLCYFLFISESTILNVLSFVGIAMSTLWLPITAGLERRVNYVVGFLLFVNWFVFWMTPIVVQGAVFKLGLHEKVRTISISLSNTETLKHSNNRYSNPSTTCSTLRKRFENSRPRTSTKKKSTQTFSRHKRISCWVRSSLLVR